MGAVGAWLVRRVRDPLLNELRQGASPSGLAASCAVGAAIGTLPFLGTTTLLCLLAGRAFRLNHVALQTTNYLLYPAQLLLLIPFVRLGETITAAKPTPLDPKTLVADFLAGPGAFLSKFGMAGAHGALGWLLIAPPAAWILYPVLRRVFGALSPSSRT